MTRNEIMALWLKHGGAVHGPRVETVTMPQEKFWAFIDDVVCNQIPTAFPAPTMEEILRDQLSRPSLNGRRHVPE